MHQRRRFWLVGLAGAAWLWSLAGTGLSEDQGRALARPPEALKAYYPPQTKQYEYPLAMLKLGQIMGASFQELYGHDFAAAAKDLGALREQYRTVAGLVPEWRSYFPEAPLDELDKKAKAKAPDAELRAATARLEEVCTRCHVKEMARVQAVYRWRAFARVSAPTRDGNTISFHQVMVQISNLLAALPHNAGNGNFKLAGQNYQALGEQFDNLEGLCVSCHDEPREYFVDKSIKGRIMRMAGMVRSQNANAPEYDKLVDEIYQKSCIPCHAIHMPPAFLQMQMGFGTAG